MKTSRDFRSGFTLTEVIIVVFVSTVVMLGVFSIYSTFSASYIFQNAKINTSRSTASFLNEFADNVHQANAIVASKVISGTTYTTGSTTLVLEIPAINSSGDIVSNTYDYAVLYSTSTYAYRLLSANGSSARNTNTKQYTDTLSNLTFTYDNATPANAASITADITTQTQVKSNTVTSHLKQQVYLRNK